MKIKDYKCECGCNDFFFANKGDHKGIYCACCGKWLKWANKDEQNLRMKQEPVLDKIKAEIESKEMIETTSEREFYNMALNDVLQIIGEYTTESEE